MMKYRFENNYLTEMCSGSEAGSYLRLIDFVYHSSLGLKVITQKKKKKKKKKRPRCGAQARPRKAKSENC